MKQNPFSVYDFLGYLIPGSILIYIYLLLDEINTNTFELDNVLKDLSENKTQDILFFIIIAYSIGHILSFLSSITIEKYGNNKYGYPSKTIIGLNKVSYWVKSKDNFKYLNILNPFKYKKPNENEIVEEKKMWQMLRMNTGRAILLIELLPLHIIELLVGRLLKFNNYYCKSADKFTIKLIKSKTVDLLNKLNTDTKPITEEDLKEIDFNRIVHHHSFENCK